MAFVSQLFDLPLIMAGLRHFCVRVGKRPFIKNPHTGRLTPQWKGNKDEGWEGSQGWLTLPEALALVENGATVRVNDDGQGWRDKAVEGIGFLNAKAGDPAYQIVGGDLDACKDPASDWISPSALEFLNRVRPFYAESSMSGTGLRFFVLGRLPGREDKLEYHGPQDDIPYEIKARIIEKKPKIAEKLSKGEPAWNGLELYEANRHLALTGQKIKSNEVEDRTPLLAAAIKRFIIKTETGGEKERPSLEKNAERLEGIVREARRRKREDQDRRLPLLPALDILDVINTAGFTESGGQLFGPHPHLGSTTGKNLVVNPGKNSYCWMHNGIDAGGDPWVWLAHECGAAPWEIPGSGLLKDPEILRQTLEYAVSKWYVSEDVLGRQEDGKSKASEGLRLENLTKWSKKLEPIIDEESGYPERDDEDKPKTKPGRTLSPSKAAVAMLAHLPLAVAAASVQDKEPSIWIYDGGIWHDQGQREIINLVDHLLQDLSYDRGLRETLRRIRGRLSKKAVIFDADPFLMPLQDRVVDLRTGAFREAKQEDYLTFKYNASWTGPADYRPLLWHLCSSLPDQRDVLTAIDIITAAALRVPFDTFYLLFGGGANGKGVFEEVLEAYFTLQRCTQIKLTELKSSRFGEGALLGKDVWIVSEVESVKDVLSSIKKISSGETIDVDVKYGSRRQGAPHLMPIFDANIAFDFGDDSKGQKRRLGKLDFPFTFGHGPEDRPKDPLMREKLTRSEVLNGIAHIIAARASELIESREIYRRKSEEEIQEEYKRQRFSLNYYCEDCLSTTWPFKDEEKKSKDPPKLTTERAYSEYLEYCKKFNVTNPAGKVPFGKYINERFGIQSTHTKESNKDIRYYPGLYLIKSASLAYADVRTTYSISSSDSSDRRGTEERQERYSGITISEWLATGATEELCSDTMRDVLAEIKNMFDYINSCKSPKDIVYENYLKNPVAPRAPVAGGQRMPKKPATEGATEDFSPVAEEEKTHPLDGINEQKHRAEQEQQARELHFRKKVFDSLHPIVPAEGGQKITFEELLAWKREAGYVEGALA